MKKRKILVSVALAAAAVFSLGSCADSKAPTTTTPVETTPTPTPTATTTPAGTTTPQGTSTTTSNQSPVTTTTTDGGSVTPTTTTTDGGSVTPTTTTTDGGSVTPTPTPTPTPTTPVVQKYTISFNANGKNVDIPNDTIDVLEVPSTLPSLNNLDNYDFVGWGLTADATTPVVAGTPLTDNITLYAIWQKTKFNISYNANGQNVDIPNDTINVLEVPSTLPSLNNLDNYDFVGWGLTADATTPVTAGTAITEDIILYAIWQKTKFNISYNANGKNSNIPNDTINVNQIPNNLPELQDIPGFNFVGWGLTADATTAVTAGTAITEDITLYAIWEVGTYSVTYHTAHGDAPQALADVSTLPTDLPELSDDDYMFEGWSTVENGTTPVTAGTTITADTNLYAIWRVKTNYEKIATNPGKVFASQFDDNTTIIPYDKSTYDSSNGFYDFSDGDDCSVVIDNQKAKLVDGGSHTSQLRANYGFLYDGIVEGILKYTPYNKSDSKNGGWSWIQFQGYQNFDKLPTTFFAIRTDNNKDINFYFTSECGLDSNNKTTYQYKATSPITYSNGTEYEIYWKYDFTAKTITVTINGTALVTNLAVPEADQPIFLTSLLFITAGSDTARYATIDDFAVANTNTGDLATTKTYFKQLLGNIYSQKNLTTDYTFFATEITNAYNDSLDGIDASESKDEALIELLVSGINYYPSDAEFKANKIEDLTDTFAEVAPRYTVHAGDITQILADATAAINAATTYDAAQDAYIAALTAYFALDDDETIRQEAISEFIGYAETKYNTLNDTQKENAQTEYDEVYLTYYDVDNETGLLDTCDAVDIADKLALGKAAIDDVIDKYKLTVADLVAQYNNGITDAKNQAKEDVKDSPLTYFAEEIDKVSLLVATNYENTTAGKATAKTDYETALSSIDAIVAEYDKKKTAIDDGLMTYIDDQVAKLKDIATYNSTYKSQMEDLVELCWLEIEDDKTDTEIAATIEESKGGVDSLIATIKTATEWTVTFKKFESDTEAFATAQVKKGGTVSAPTTNPTSDDYAFVEWDFDFATAITANTTILAKWHDYYKDESIEIVKSTSTSQTSGTIFNAGSVSVTLAGGSVTLTEKNATSTDSKYTFTHALLPGGSGRTYTFNSSIDQKIIVYFTICDSKWADQGANLKVDTKEVTKYTSSSKCPGSTPVPYELNLTANTDYVLSSTSGRLVIWGYEYINVTKTEIKSIEASVSENDGYITVENINLIDSKNNKIAIDTDIDVEVRDSSNIVVDDITTALPAGTYTVYVKYGEYTVYSEEKVIS